MAQRDDGQELREVFTALQETAMPLLREMVGLLPELVRQVYAVFYSEETAQHWGEASALTSAPFKKRGYLKRCAKS